MDVTLSLQNPVFRFRVMFRFRVIPVDSSFWLAWCGITRLDG